MSIAHIPWLIEKILEHKQNSTLAREMRIALDELAALRVLVERQKCRINRLEADAIASTVIEGFFLEERARAEASEADAAFQRAVAYEAAAACAPERCDWCRARRDCPPGVLRGGDECVRSRLAWAEARVRAGGA